MSALSNILHALVDASAHVLPAGRAAELHDLADEAGTAAGDVADLAAAIRMATIPKVAEAPAAPAEEAPAPAEVPAPAEEIPAPAEEAPAPEEAPVVPAEGTPA